MIHIKLIFEIFETPYGVRYESSQVNTPSTRGYTFLEYLLLEKKSLLYNLIV
jgi:hypothetical protein